MWDRERKSLPQTEEYIISYFTTRIRGGLVGMFVEALLNAPRKIELY
jgi:hypothetical protein